MADSGSLDCLHPRLLALFLEGRLEEGLRAGLESHLDACPPCRLSVSQTVQETDGRNPVALPTPLVLRVAGRLQTRSGHRRHFLRPALGVAAGLLLAVGLASFWRMNRDSGIPLEQVSSRTLVLPEGSRLAFEEGCQYRFLPVREGDRVLMELRQGAVEARVEKAAGSFRIQSPAGEVRVVGTRFRAKAFQLNTDDPLDCLCVEVAEGAVRLQNGQGDVLLEAGKRGIVRKGYPPVALDQVSDYKTILANVAEVLRWPPEKASERPAALSLLAATFWGASWKQQPDWNALTGTPGEAREAALALLRLGSN